MTTFLEIILFRKYHEKPKCLTISYVTGTKPVYVYARGSATIVRGMTKRLRDAGLTSVWKKWEYVYTDIAISADKLKEGLFISSIDYISFHNLTKLFYAYAILGTISFFIGIIEVVWFRLKHFRSYDYHKIRRRIIHFIQNLCKFAITTFLLCKWGILKCFNCFGKVKTGFMENVAKLKAWINHLNSCKYFDTNL